VVNLYPFLLIKLKNVMFVWLDAGFECTGFNRLCTGLPLPTYLFRSCE